MYLTTYHLHIIDSVLGHKAYRFESRSEATDAFLSARKNFNVDEIRLDVKDHQTVKTLYRTIKNNKNKILAVGLDG